MNRLHVHVPYQALAARTALLVSRKLNPEIFFATDILETLREDLLRREMAPLHEAGLETTIHAPFIDLNPGSFEPLLREATALRFRQVMAAAAVVRPRVMVFHPGYDRWRYGEQRERWVKESLEVWLPVAEAAEKVGTVIALENIFDEDPDVLAELLERIGSPRFGHCFDCGHWNLFARTSMPEWFAVLGEKMVEAHIHDNGGLKDDHGPPGSGNIDFDLLFSLLDRLAPDAVRTIEAHTLENMEKSLVGFSRFFQGAYLR